MAQYADFELTSVIVVLSLTDLHERCYKVRDADLLTYTVSSVRFWSAAAQDCSG